MGVEFIYFDVQGRGTQFRLCMDIAGLDYTNTHVPCAEWQSVKADFEQDGLGQLPILKVMVSRSPGLPIRNGPDKTNWFRPFQIFGQGNHFES